MNTARTIATILGRASSAVLAAIKFTALVAIAVVLLFIWIIVSVSRQIFYATYPR